MKQALVQLAIPASTGTQDYLDAVFASDVKGAILALSSAAVNATNTAIARIMHGSTDGTIHRSSAIASANGVTTSQINGNNSTNVLQVMNSNGGTNETAAFSSILATGLRLNWTAIATQRLVNCLLLGDSDVTFKVRTAVFTGSGDPETVTVTHGLGGVPDALYAYGYLGSGAASHGFWANGVYASHAYKAVDGQPTTLLGGYVNDAAIIRQTTHLASEFTVTISNVTSTTFDVTASGAVTTDTIAFDCFRVTGGTFKVGVLTTPTATGTVSVTGMSGAPLVVLLLPTKIQTLNTLDNGDGAGCFGLGMAVNNASVVQQLACCLSSDDGVTTTVERSYTANNKALVICDAATGNVDVEAELSAFNSDGFTLNFTNVATDAYLIPYLAFGLAGAAPTTIWPQYRQHPTQSSTLIRL